MQSGAAEDFVHIMQTTVQKLAGRIEVEREVATVLAGKRLEGRIMEIMPLAILAYLQVASGEFLDALYGSVFGVAVMSIAFCCYSCRHQMVRAYIGYSDLTKGLWIKRGKM